MLYLLLLSAKNNFYNRDSIASFNYAQNDRK